MTENRDFDMEYSTRHPTTSWRLFKEEFEVMLRARFESSELEVSSSNLGWRNSEGKTLELENSEILDKVVGDLREFNIYVREKPESVQVLVTHHDSPTIRQADHYRVTE